MLTASTQPTEIQVNYSDWTINVQFPEFENVEIPAESDDFSLRTEHTTSDWAMWTADPNPMWNALDSTLMWR